MHYEDETECFPTGAVTFPCASFVSREMCFQTCHVQRPSYSQQRYVLCRWRCGRLSVLVIPLVPGCWPCSCSGSDGSSMGGSWALGDTEPVRVSWGRALGCEEWASLVVLANPPCSMLLPSKCAAGSIAWLGKVVWLSNMLMPQVFGNFSCSIWVYKVLLPLAALHLFGQSLSTYSAGPCCELVFNFRES